MTTPKVKLAEPPTLSNRGKPQTLVIDDDIAVADTAAMVLKSGGFEAGSRIQRCRGRGTCSSPSVRFPRDRRRDAGDEWH